MDEHKMHETMYEKMNREKHKECVKLLQVKSLRKPYMSS